MPLDQPIEADILPDPGSERAHDPARPPRARRRGGAWRLALTSVMTAVLAVVVGVGAMAILVPAVTGSTALTVLTSSMQPALPAGTLVVVRPTDPADIEPGMVLTYQIRSGEPELVTHRVTQRLRTADGEYVFVTQGDANPTADADPVKQVQVRGTVWYAIPYLGWVATAVTGGQRAIVVTVVVVALFGYAAWMFGSAAFARLRRRADAASDAASGDVPSATSTL